MSDLDNLQATVDRIDALMRKMGWPELIPDEEDSDAPDCQDPTANQTAAV